MHDFLDNRIRVSWFFDCLYGIHSNSVLWSSSNAGRSENFPREVEGRRGSMRRRLQRWSLKDKKKESIFYKQLDFTKNEKFCNMVSRHWFSAVITWALNYTFLSEKKTRFWKRKVFPEHLVGTFFPQIFDLFSRTPKVSNHGWKESNFENGRATIVSVWSGAKWNTLIIFARSKRKRWRCRN